MSADKWFSTEYNYYDKVVINETISCVETLANLVGKKVSYNSLKNEIINKIITYI